MRKLRWAAQAASIAWVIAAPAAAVPVIAHGGHVDMQKPTTCTTISQKELERARQPNVGDVINKLPSLKTPQPTGCPPPREPPVQYVVPQAPGAQISPAQLEPMGNDGGPNAPQFPNGAKAGENPSPPEHSIIDDLVEPPSPGEVKAIEMRLNELRGASNTLAGMNGCDPSLWAAHLRHLEDLAKRTRQMADWANTPGQTTGTDPAAAERVAREARRQLDEAWSLRARDCLGFKFPLAPKPYPSVAIDKGLMVSPPLMPDTGVPYTRVQWLRIRTRWALDAIDEAFYECDGDWLDELYAKLNRLIAETNAILSSSTLSYEDAEEAKRILNVLKEARADAGSYSCPHYAPPAYIDAYLEALSRGEEGPGIVPKKLVELGEQLEPRIEPKPVPEKPVIEPMSAPGGGMTFPTNPPAAPTDPAKEYESIWNATGMLILGYFYNGPCNESHFRSYLAGLEVLDRRADALAAAVKEGGDFSRLPPAKMKRLSDDIKRHIDEAKQVLAADCPAGVKFQMNPFSGHILVIDNAERARVGALPVHWDPRLAARSEPVANEVLKAGTPEHSTRVGRGIERENISMGLRGWGPERLMKSWLDEPLQAGYFPNVSATGNWADAGHKSQIDAINQTDLGCAWAAGGAFEVLVCHYSPGGNKDGDPVGFRDPANFMFGPIKFDAGYSEIRKEYLPSNPDGLQFGDETVSAWKEYLSARRHCDVAAMEGAINKLKSYGQAALEHSVEERSKGNANLSSAYNAMTRQIAERVQDAMLHRDACQRNPYEYSERG